MINKYVLFAALVVATLGTVDARADEESADSGDTNAATAATKPKEGESTVQVLSVEDILKRDPERSEYVEDNRCISSHRIKNVEVIDQNHVAIRMGRDKYYLIQFPRPCRDLRRNRPVFLETNSSSLCKMDRLWGSREVGLGGIEKGMVCHIPGFQSVTKEQIVLLKDALKAERRRARQNRNL